MIKIISDLINGQREKAMSSIPNTMQAIVMQKFGAAEVLEYQEIPVPVIKADEILVQVCNAGVSPFDVHMREGWYKNSSNYLLPIVLGWELSGIVVAVGSDISQFKEGDAVFAHPSVYRNGGAYAQYAAVKASEAVHKPIIVSHQQAAASVMNTLTAWQVLFDVAQLTAGQKILIHAAAGGVGHLAVQLAKWKGAYVIGTASAKNKEFLLTLGADEVIDYATVEFERAVKNIDVVFDTIGGETLLKSFSILKPNGIVVSIVDFEHIKKAAGYGVRGENVIVSPNVQQLLAIANLMAEEKLKAHIETVFSLQEAARAHKLVQAGHTRGKILLEI
nr:Zinc-binding dehydrogenase [uncultured bacterium]